MRRTTTHRGPQRRRLMTTALAATAAAAALLPASALAANRYWVASTISGNPTWSNTADWSTTQGGSGGASVPGPLDTAFLSYNDPLGINVPNPTLDVTTSLTSLNIGSAATGTPALNLNASLAFSATTETIAYQANGRGAFNQSAGTNSVGSTLYVGYETNSRGFYNLSGTGTLLVPSSAGSLTVGFNGAGTVNQTGGSVSVGTTSAFTPLYLGYNPGSVGTYSLSGTASLTTDGNENVGYNNTPTTGTASGSFVQTGGAHSAVALFLAGSSGSTGTYSLSGTGTLSTSTTYIAYGNSTSNPTALGSFTQSAGYHNAGSLYVGYFAGSGSYTLTGGSLTSGTTVVGNSGNATGDFNQTGGTHITNGLTLGNTSGTIGRYTLSGTGSLTVFNGESVGVSGTGSFTQAAGSHSVSGTLSLGSSTGTGYYSLSGGSLTATTTESLFAGTFSQSGGANSTGPNSPNPIVLGLSVNNTATYALSGGTLNVNGIETLSGTFVQTGGTHTIASPSPDVQLAITGQPATPAVYSLSGTGSLAVNGNLYVGGSSHGPDGYGILNVAGGSLTVANTLTLYDYPAGSAVNFSAGSLTTASLDDPGHRLNWTGGALAVTGPAGLSVGAGGNFTSVTLNSSKSLSVSTLTLSTGGSLTLDIGGSLSYSNALLLSGGTLALNFNPLTNSSLISGTGTIAGNAAFTNAGSLSIPSGTLTLSATAANSSSGLVSLVPGAQLALTGAALINTGVITLSPGSRVTGPSSIFNTTGGVVQGAGTLAAPLFNVGGATLLVSTGTLTLNQPTSNFGTISLAGPAATLAGAAITNSGTLTGDGTVSNPLTNPSPGQIRADAAQTLTLSNMSTNAGTLALNAGTLAFSQPLTNTGTITGRGTLRAPSLTTSGTLMLTGGPSDLYTPITAAPASHITVASAATATFYNSVTLQPGSVFTVGPNSTATFLAPVTGAAQFTGPGTKDFEAGASSPSNIDTNNVGSTTVESSASLTTNYLRESSLTLYGPLALSPNSPTSRLSTLAILAPTGSLDLSNDKLVLAAGGSSQVSTIRQYLLNHQLFSSTADADPQHRLAIAYADNALLGATTWGSLPVSPSDLLLKLTYYGDANLDGVVNSDDYALIDRSFAKSLPNAHWTDGDFTYDGIIDQNDYLLLDTTFSQAQGLSPGLLAIREAEFGDAYVRSLLAAVPEPSSLTCLLATFALLTRRSRQFRPNK